MKKTLYLMLAVVLVISAIGLIKITTLFRQNLLNIGGGEEIIVLASRAEPVASTRERIKELSRQERGDGDFLASLPCFRCHQVDSWQGADGPGSFPHMLHKDMDLHCLNCHAFVAHGQGMKVIHEDCETCHE